MKKIIVTSTRPYIDIDAYGSGIAYAFLLCVSGYEARFLTSSQLNYSVPTSIREKNCEIKLSNYKMLNENYNYIVVDVSDYKKIDKIADISKVIEVIDHHMGYELFWKDKTKVTIESIGAVCTIIFERWLNSGLLNKIPINIAKLLISGILDNTINLQAQITTSRDIYAYNTLLELIGEKDWGLRYYDMCSNMIRGNINKSLISDMKIIDFIPCLPKFIGQLAIYKSSEVLLQNYEEIVYFFNRFSNDWVLNLIDISCNVSIFITECSVSQEKISSLFDVKFYNGIAYCNRSWLRKEIVNYALIKRGKDEDIIS